jgi:hypothetical protein
MHDETARRIIAVMRSNAAMPDYTRCRRDPWRAATIVSRTGNGCGPSTSLSE